MSAFFYLCIISLTRACSFLSHLHTGKGITVMSELLNITINQGAVDLLVKQEVQRLLPHILMFQKQNAIEPIAIDIKKMSELTGLSQSALRANILTDPRIQVTEINVMERKRLWNYQAFKTAFLEIAQNDGFAQL